MLAAELRGGTDVGGGEAAIGCACAMD